MVYRMYEFNAYKWLLNQYISAPELRTCTLMNTPLNKWELNHKSVLVSPFFAHNRRAQA